MTMPARIRFTAIMKRLNTDDERYESVFRILYVDDELALLDICKEFLEGSGEMLVDTASSVEEAWSSLRNTDYDAIVSDYQMPKKDGIEFLKELRSNGDHIPFILFTGRGREEVVIEALNSGANFYVQKGGNPKAQFAELTHKIRISIESRVAEESLKESEARFHSLADNVFDGMIVSIDGSVVDVNRAFLDLMGYDKKEIVGTRTEKLITKASMLRLQKELERSLPTIYIADMIRKDGKVLTIAIKGNDVIWNGKPARLAALQNITEQKRIEDELRRSEEKLDLALKGGELGLWDWMIQTGEIEVNDRYAQMLGYQRQELAPTTFDSNQKRFHPDDLKRSNELLELYLSGKIDHFECETRIRHKDGRWVWILDKGSISARDENGRPIRMSGTHLDITERKMAEDALKLSETKYRSLVDNVAEAIVVIQDGMFQMVNPRAIEILEYPEEDLVGRPFLDFIYPDDHELVSDHYRRRSSGEVIPTRYDFRLQVKNGGIKWVALSAIAISWEGRPATLNMVTDITERKRSEDVLRQQTKTLSILYDVISKANRAFSLDELYETVLGESMKMMDLDGGAIYIIDEVKREARIAYSKGLPSEFLKMIERVPIDIEPFDTIYKKNEPLVRLNLVDNAPAHSKSSGYQTMVSVPLVSKGGIIGSMNIASRKHLDPRNEEVQTLVSIGVELGSSIKRMMAEMESARFAQNISAFFNSIDDMVFVLDRHGTIIEVNNAVKRQLLYEPVDLLGSNIACVHLPEQGSEALRTLREAFDGKLTSHQLPLLTKDGRTVHAETNVTIGWWNDQEVIMGVSRDVGQRKRLEDEVKNKALELERNSTSLALANKKLSLLSSITRHDIINQMMVLDGYLEIASEKSKDPSLSRCLEKMGRSSENVKRQIQFTKEYQEIGVMAPKWFSADTKATESMELLHSRNIELVNEVGNLEFLADPLAEKIPYNLIDNSIRYGEHVTRIRIYTEPAGDSMKFIIEDDGIGISYEDKKYLFQKGFGKHTGFGLFLSKEILAITGMTITENGIPGKGARFEITIPPGAWRYKLNEK